MSEHTLASRGEAFHQMSSSGKPSLEKSNVVTSHVPLAVSITNPLRSMPEVNFTGPMWNLPGLDKATFYGAALYLHAAAKGQLRESKHRGDDWGFDPHASITDATTKDFLDRLADCFARSKSKDAQDHVSATAMEINVDLSQNQREIKIFVAKNLSGKNMDALPPGGHASMVNEDEEFASKLCKWFNDMSSRKKTEPIQAFDKEILEVMHQYNTSRLTFYMNKIRGWNSSGVSKLNIWHMVEPVVRACKTFSNAATREELNRCALDASKCRSDALFQEFSENIDTLVDNEETKTQYRNLEKWINYLGRLGDAYSTFRAFCTEEKRRHYSYEIIVLKSPVEEEWPIQTYRTAIDSWAGDLGLNDKRNENQTVNARLDELVAKCRGTARVHCEIQLLDYFVRHGTQKNHLDYIGCSKKSCWLCWQLLGDYGRFSTKTTHRMIYPLWAIPTDFYNAPRKAQFAAAVVRTYRDMITLIEEKVLFQKDFSSRMNISHTSARLVHNPTLLSNPSVQTKMSGSTLAHSEISLSSSASTISKGRAPIATIPVVHFPADSPQPRLVSMDVFERLASDYEEGCVNMRRVLLEPWSVDRTSREIVLPFQLNTRALESNPKAYREVNLLDWQSATWCIEHQPWICNSKVSYATMFRLDEDSEKPNPWFLRMLDKHYGTSFREDLMPWYGDVFVIAMRRISSYQPDLVVALEDDAMKLDECVEAIITDLTSQWELNRYSSIKGYHMEQLQTSLASFLDRGIPVVREPRF
ncbi:hypothetical protein BKA66DRAFT_579133 [Pyrenochaeta sp. MPI-SDFR-AT-0127]|nr:hypothetical protein BKA66DRAFT_579133 [Pyrenochaeta sp. MPI-SDFR-AT-0127]